MRSSCPSITWLTILVKERNEVFVFMAPRALTEVCEERAESTTELANTFPGRN
jgi:hypothetical protein